MTQDNVPSDCQVIYFTPRSWKASLAQLGVPWPPGIKARIVQVPGTCPLAKLRTGVAMPGYIYHSMMAKIVRRGVKREGMVN